MSDETAALKAEIQDLKDQVTALKRLLGGTADGFNRLNLATDKLTGPFSSLLDATSGGATGLSVYNDTIAKGQDALKQFGGLLGTYGETLTALTGVSAQYMQAVTKQTDEQYRAYQGLAAVGAGFQEVTKNGRPVKGTFESINDLANQFGIVSSKDLPRFVQMIGQSSETLAKFGGTVADGMKQFANLADSVQNTGLQTEFLNMGMTVDSINKGLQGYLKTQTLYAAGQMKSQQELNAGAADYIRNLDMLSKLTGKSVETLQKEQDEALLNEQYAIHQRELQQKIQRGGEEGLAAQKQLAEEQKVINQTEGSVRKGFMAAFTGMGMQFEEGRKLYMSAPETFNLAAKGVGTNANQLLDTAKSEFGKTMDTFGGLIMAAGNSLFAFVSDMRKVENLQGTAEEREARARENQKRTKEATDEGVAGMTALAQEQRNAARDLNQFVQIGVLPSIYFLGQLAKNAREAADLLPGAKPRPVEQQQRQGLGPEVGKGVSGRTADDIKRAATESAAAGISDFAKKIEELNAKLSGQIPNSPAYNLLKSQIADLNKFVEELKKFTGTPTDIVPIPRVTPAPAAPAAPDSSVIIPAVTPNRPVSLRSTEIIESTVAEINRDRSDRNAQPSVSSVTSTTNEQLITSNTLMLAKMDELIGLMRTSNGYQQKISQQTYA